MRGANCLTDPLFFDTDCLSAFLWVRSEHLLAKLYSGRIAIPRQVYNELSAPGIEHLKKRLDLLIGNGDASVLPIMTDTPAYDLYIKLTSAPDAGHSIIGKGEAAAIALAAVSGGICGIVASNNLKDVAAYASEMGLRLITTGDILIAAYREGLITEDDGNSLWSAMLAKRRKIGAASFSDYLNTHRNSPQ
jgi:predicted nucleic acid-binding protein